MSALRGPVVAAPPDTWLVAALGRAIEPLIHAPKAIEPARIGGVGMVDDAVLAHERGSCPADRAKRWMRPCRKWRRIGRRARGTGRRIHGMAAALEIILDFPLALLLLGVGDVEVEVEVAADRGHPGKAPPHAPFVGLKLRERRPRLAESVTSWFAR